MDDTIHILGIAGSIRKDSCNRACLRAAEQLLPENAELHAFDLAMMPMYNTDLEHDIPDIVTELKDEIRKSDALLLVTPEYNYSVSAVLKNALDWASRPYGDNAWAGKPAAVMGSSCLPSFGTVRAQNHMRQIFVALDMLTFNRPEVFISDAENKLDARGNLVDEDTVHKIEALLAELTAFTKQLSRAAVA